MVLSCLYNGIMRKLLQFRNSATCSNQKFLLTSARIVLDKELIESHPTTTDTDHDGRTEDTDQAKLLGFSELEKENISIVEKH
jgi:hypothetical protein